MGRRILMLVASIATLRAQSPPAFDAASIKPASISISHEGGNRSRVEFTPSSLTMLNVDLAYCVQWAYDVPGFQVAGSHVSPESYDILANSAAAVPASQLRVMLQELLAKRFQLAVHRETRQLPVYALVTAKSGPKLPAATADSSLPEAHAAESLPKVRGDSFLFEGNSMAEFAAKLSQLNGVNLPVVDRTGIKGIYDLTLTGAAAAAREGDGAAIFSLLEEQLGLKLEPAKAPYEVIVIDHAAKPTAN